MTEHDKQQTPKKESGTMAELVNMPDQFQGLPMDSLIG
jgi:hypothetical protein